MNIRYLSYDDRKRIEQAYNSGVEISDIAASLGVNQTTIYRELKRGETGELDNNGRIGYSAAIGQQTLHDNFRRRGNRKPAAAKQ